ncbi:MYBL1 [Branchiostoma lanceolatum]|uniref:MYBL1 protein n=1 Tax=Branchiostoma lanceolatum TaxID=7740 RepID=A0A8K0EJ54_BRALA|nr:MYBL1 [Branchiostoma lanceolatum]
MSRHRYCSYVDDTDSDLSQNDHDYDISSIRGGKRLGSKTRWTKDEDEALRQVALDQGSDDIDWKVVAKSFPDRSDVQCQHRWEKVLNPDLVKGPWTKEEDEKVVELVRKYGPKRWSLIAKHLKGRIGKQCRERWHNHLNPEIKKCAWSEEEDRIIYEAHKRLGNRWAEIAKLLPGRTDNAIKNHWNSTMRRKYEAEEGITQPYRRRNSSSSMYYPLSHNHMSYPTYYPPPQQDVQQPMHQQDQIQAQGYMHQQQQPMYMNTGDCNMAPPADHNMQQQQHYPADSMSQWNSDVVDGMMGVGMSNGMVQGPEDPSPTKWIVYNMDNDAIVSPLRSVPEFTETLQMVDAEGEEWDKDFGQLELIGDMAINRTADREQVRHLPAEGSTEYRFDGRAIQGLAKETPGKSGGLIPITSPITSKFTTPPILRRKRKKHNSLSTSTLSSMSHDTTLTPCKETDNTPQRTPIKPLPFSPSQFLNTPDINAEVLTSTPICSRAPTSTTPVSGMLNTPATSVNTSISIMGKENKDAQEQVFRTPLMKRRLIDMTPRTPTPFKDALAELEKKGGKLKNLPVTPGHIEKDLSEVIKQEDGGKYSELFCNNETPDRKRKSENPSPSKKARKSLACLENWAPDADENAMEALMDTPMKNLLSEVSLLFSPPAGSRVEGGKDVQLADTSLGLNNAFNLPSSPTKMKLRSASKRHVHFQETPVQNRQTSKVVKLDTRYEQVACGKTADQQLLIQQARAIMQSCKPRALKL